MMESLISALKATGYRFASRGWAKGAKELREDHGSYTPDGAGSLWAEGHRAESTRRGIIDYYTRDDSDTPRRTIEAALNSVECSWYLDYDELDTDTGFIHLVWAFEFPEEAAEHG